MPLTDLKSLAEQCAQTRTGLGAFNAVHLDHAFVKQTGVALLAVAVGSSHAMVSRDAAIDAELVQRIHAAVPVPLVLHGSSGVSDQGMRAAITSGITKVNVSTHLNGIFTGAVRKFLEGHPCGVCR